MFQNVDGGWIEGKNAKGKVGLFPETYVTRMSTVSFLRVKSIYGVYLF